MDINNGKKALLAIMAAVIETVKESGTLGAPGGHLYAALMAHGVTFDQFNSMMSMLTSTKILAKRGECYFPGEALPR